MNLVERRTLEEHVQAVTGTRLMESLLKTLHKWGWLPYTEVVEQPPGSPERTRTHVYAVRPTGDGVATLAIDIKVAKNGGVTRPDATLQSPAQSSCHTHFVCSPAGVVPRGSVPSGYGLIEWCAWDESIRIPVHPEGPRIDACDPRA